MKINKKYSHLNGEEYLIVHHNNLYKEIKDIIKNIDAEKIKTKISREIRKKGNKSL
jgi:molybdate-binding protein